MYGLSFYRANTTGLDSWIRAKNTANPTLAAANLAAKAADNLNIQSSRGQVLESFQGTSTAPIIPTETQIRYWMINGLGYKRQTFTAYQNSLFNADTVYAATIAADRAFEANILAPLTISQEENKNGNPSESTQDVFSNNKTTFLLAADNGKDYVDVANSLTVTGNNTPLRDARFYRGFTTGGTGYLYTQSNQDQFNPGPSSFSLEIWINRSSSGGMNIYGRNLIPNQTSYTQPNVTGYNLYINSSNKLVWELPPFPDLVTPDTIPVNTWTHICIAFVYASQNSKRIIYVNGFPVVVRSSEATNKLPRTMYSSGGIATFDTTTKEPQITSVTAFTNSATYYSGGNWSNAIGVNSTRGLSVNDKVKIYGYKPFNESWTSTEEGYISDISRDGRLVQLQVLSLAGTGLISNNGFSSDVGGSPYLVKTGYYNGSPSYRGVVARSVTYPNRIFLDPIGRPYRNSINPITYGYSGTAEFSFVTYAPQVSYEAGEAVVFRGVSRGGISLDTIYYITSVVYGENESFGGYITISPTNIGYSTNQDTQFTYWTDNGSTLQMYMEKVPVLYNIGSGIHFSAARTTICYNDSVNNSIRTTQGFVGTIGGVKLVTNGVSNSSMTTASAFTPDTVFTNTTSTGSVKLLINSNNGSVPVNTSSIATNFGFNNSEYIVCYNKPAYLGAVAYNGSAYSTVTGGDFIIPPQTNWCAEAWVFAAPRGGAILGSGATGDSSWAITMSATGKVTFSHPNFTVDSGTTLIAAKTWTHIAVSLNANTFRLFINGAIVGSTTITSTYFKPNSSDSKYYIGKHDSSYFSGWIVSPRLVVGKSIYTTTFTPSTTKPSASRATVLSAFAANDYGPVIPEEGDIQYWMVKGFDTFPTIFFSSTDITWNQVDSFYVTGGSAASTKTYDVCIGKEILVTQILVGTPDIRQAYYSNVITTNSSTGSVNITGGTVDAYITVYMR